VSAVVIGSYREDLAGLLAFCETLRHRGITVLHPARRARAVGEDRGFVRLNTDASPHKAQVQRAVFALIDRADCVLVYALGGRVGVSTALEIGYAIRAGKPVLSTTSLQDETLNGLLTGTIRMRDEIQSGRAAV
jgi:nucleoside 2-deoxyribosyltransferase